MAETLEEWRDYISRLKGMALTSKLRAINSQTFVNMMMEDGFNLAYTKQVVTMMAVQKVATGGRLPEMGLWNLIDLVREAHPDGVIVMNDDQIDAIVPPEEPPDQWDRMMDEDELEEEWGPVGDEALEPGADEPF